MTRSTRPKKGILVLGLLIAMISQGLWTQPATAIQPEPLDIVVWTVNTAFNSQGDHAPCAEIGCHWYNFSNVVASTASCPDVVLGQEINSRAEADRFKNQLDKISPNCGIYKRYFYDIGGEEIAKVAIGWREERFFLGTNPDGSWDVINKREKWPSGDGKCEAKFDDRGTPADTSDDKPSRHVTAVRLVDRTIDQSIIAGSIHWDAGLTTHCIGVNLMKFGERIVTEWGSTPIVIGGDHNRKNGRGEGAEEIRQEETLKPWYSNFRATGYEDPIKELYPTLADGTPSEIPDICDQWTYSHDLQHSEGWSDNCRSNGHFRIDFTWYRNFLNKEAYTHQGYVGTKAKGKFYSDHRSIVTKYSYLP